MEPVKVRLGRTQAARLPGAQQIAAHQLVQILRTDPETSPLSEVQKLSTRK